MSLEHKVAMALMLTCATACERGLGGGSSCGDPYVETCDDTPNPEASSGTVTGLFGDEELVFEIDSAEVSDCAPPMSINISSTIAEGSDTTAYSFRARFRLNEDGTFDPSFHDFSLSYHEDGDSHLYDSSYNSGGGNFVSTDMDVETDEIGTWTLKGSFEGWLAGALDDEGSSIDISGSFDAATESERKVCD